MTLAERIGADYRRATMTVGPHPLALRREELRAQGVLSCAEMLAKRNHSAAQIAGAVITRQRPQTAKGFFFLTLEDETGIVNAIVTPAFYETHRAVLTGEPFLMLSGVVQQQDGVASLKVVHAFALQWSHEGGGLAMPDGHNFH
jgi:error-prone DNA polymerase